MPAQELLALVRLEAARAQAFVIGEDLGTVEDEVREVLADRGLLGTKVVWFEDDQLGAMPEQSLATITTHDLPTIAGVWSGADCEPVFRERLQAAVGLPDGTPVSDVTRAAHWALLRGSSALRLLTTDDLAGMGLRPNRPGTVEPRNWSLPLPVPVDRLPLPAPLPAPAADARVG
jgi:4-alpha-glucanotransferase